MHCWQLRRYLINDNGYRVGELLDQILSALTLFAGSHSQTDDITLLAVDR